jgi:hypothetical protein
LLQAPNVAHVEAVSGTFIVPAYSPYDRQMLRDHVETLAARGSTLTLGVHGTRWTVTLHGLADERCATCAQILGRLSCSRVDDEDATCIDCAMRPQHDTGAKGHNA